MVVCKVFDNLFYCITWNYLISYLLLFLFIKGSEEWLLLHGDEDIIGSHH